MFLNGGQHTARESQTAEDGLPGGISVSGDTHANGCQQREYMVEKEKKGKKRIEKRNAFGIFQRRLETAEALEGEQSLS